MSCDRVRGTMAWFFKQAVPAEPQSSTVGQRVTLSGCSMTDVDEQEDSQTSGGTSSSLTQPPFQAAWLPHSCYSGIPAVAEILHVPST